MIKKKDQQLTSKEAERLLTQQTIVILNAVDEKLGKVDEKLGKMEIRINQKFDRLTTTLDKFLEQAKPSRFSPKARFLKRLTDMEDEFEIMKADINRMKKVIREKLGVELS